MAKAEIVTKIAVKTGFEKHIVMQVYEGIMKIVKTSMINGEKVYLRSFCSFALSIVLKKIVRNISKNMIRLACTQHAGI